MDAPEQAAINDGLDRQELADQRHSKQTHAHTGTLHGLLNREAILPFQREGFSMMRCLPAFAAAMVCGVVLGIAANRNDVQAGILEHLIEAGVSLDDAAVPGAKLAGSWGREEQTAVT
jgi:hypothetical protein